MLIGKNIRLRPITTDDSRLLADWFSNPEYMGDFYNVWPITRTDSIGRTIEWEISRSDRIGTGLFDYTGEDEAVSRIGNSEGGKA